MSIGPDEFAAAAPLGPAIEATLTAATGRPVHVAEEPVRLTGGNSAGLFTIRVTQPPDGWPAELVLRLPADRTAGPREAVIQRGVAALGYPAPAVLSTSAGTDNPLGRPYLLMAKLPGRPLFSDAGPIAAYRGFRRAPGMVGRLMADLHDLDPEPVTRELAAEGVAADDLGARPLLDDLQQAIDATNDPGLREIGSWLDAHAPAPARPVVCHGDLHALNVLAEGDRGTVVDWELATIGDPALDVARTCLLLRAVPVEMPDRLRGLVQRLGRRAAAQFEAVYADRHRLDARAVVWHEVLHAGRIVGRLARREADDRLRADPVLAAWAPTEPYLRARLAELTHLRL